MPGYLEDRCACLLKLPMSGVEIIYAEPDLGGSRNRSLGFASRVEGQVQKRSVGPRKCRMIPAIPGVVELGIVRRESDRHAKDVAVEAGRTFQV